MAEAVFPDNTVLCNFAAVNRLDLLRDWLRGRGRWTDAVALEASRSAAHLPALGSLAAEGWLGDPVKIDDDFGVRQVEHLRTAVFGGTSGEPLKHLGEAQSCYLIKEVADWRGSWWITDDADALEYARASGITTRETIDVMRGIVADGDLTAREAFDLMNAMEKAGLVESERRSPPWGWPRRHTHRAWQRPGTPGHRSSQLPERP
ncbi:MAG: hypothetical protein V9G19_19130 [Tetrasphaera sp.]